MKRKQLCLRMAIITIIPFLLCGCQCYNHQEISAIPESTYGILMVHRDATSDELKMYTEKAIELYNEGKIAGLVIVAKNNEADMIHSFLADSDLKDHVTLNVNPGRRIKVLSGIGNILGYHNSYIIISRRCLCRLKEIYL